MVKHIVLWKLRDDADKQKNMDRMISELTSLVGKIEGLVSIEMGYNFNTANDYDVVLYAAFKNAAALKYYQTHPEHVKCKDFIEGITVARIAADYCFDEGVLEARPYNEVPDAPAEELPSMPKTAARAASRKIAADEAAAEAEASSFAAAPTPAPAPAPKAEPREDNRPSFFKKKVEIDVTPLDQRSDTWTCPSCGKVMPNYVGTCGCGEPKPFGFDDVPPALQPEPTVGQVKNAVSAHNTPAPAPKAAEPAKAPAAKADTKDSGLPSFFKKKVEIDATPLNQRSDTWTCPSCGKIMPNYVGTCGCGEPKPFSFDDVPPALQPEPTVGQVRNAVSAHNTESRPTRRRVVQEEPAPQNTADTGFSSSNDDANGGFDFDNAPPPAPMRFDDAPPPAPMRFDDAPPPAPMRFEEEEDDSFNFNFDDAPPPAPMRFDDAPPAAPMRFEDNAPAAAAPKAPEKKHLFGKKAKEEEAMRRAEEAVNNRRDIPNSGSTWTCPNCGKVMPKYVGTCGCGEPQPFGD